MLRAHKVRPAGTFTGGTSEMVTLDREDRHRRRIMLDADSGTRFMLDLPEATPLREGDGLELEDGRIIVVKAAAEELLEITAPTQQHLVRLAWHIGNRHLAAMIEKDRLLIRRDHVIADMIVGLGGFVCEVETSFEPEGGAYDHGSGHGHAHEH